jgi:two-component system chemotaxis response regulator CheB
MMDSDELPGTNRHLIKVLVVDDSPTTREFLGYLLASDQEIQVIATATNGEEALEAVKNKKPDVVTMDIHMPKMNGYEATRAIMESCPVPIIIVTGSSLAGEAESPSPFSALEAGAVAVIKRPPGIEHPDHAATARALIQTVKLMSEVKVVKRWAPRKITGSVISAAVQPELALSRTKVRLVAIGSSTGGPLVLQQIFSSLPKDFSVPIIVVQHITDGFVEGFADWLTETSSFPVSVAVNGEMLLPGHAYIAPNGSHATVNGLGRIILKKGAPENGHFPSVSCLFRSVAAAYGHDAVGVLLTGMGKDGAAELGLMKNKGAITLVQDKASSIVHGMPGEAIALGAAMYVLSPEKIAATLVEMARESQEERSSK